MSWIDALGWVGSALLVFSLLQARVLRLRMLNLIACLMLVVFNAVIEVWPMVAMNIVLAAINLWFIRALLSSRHDEGTYEVLEVGSNDEYLRHVLRVHGADILKHQPDFVWDGAEPDNRAYLVQKSDETVGVVLLHDEGGGEARIVLDYVTPRFRDFSPGEFVWRKSDLLRGEGFSKVTTPPNMVEPYYDRLGFERRGEVYELSL
jgi:hypothetical protein